jgi:hypothetical protein
MAHAPKLNPELARQNNMRENSLKLKRDAEAIPKCHHCTKHVDTVSYRELYGGFWGKRYIYFCPKCLATLGVSHRKGFFMG